MSDLKNWLKSVSSIVFLLIQKSWMKTTQILMSVTILHNRMKMMVSNALLFLLKVTLNP